MDEKGLKKVKFGGEIEVELIAGNYPPESVRVDHEELPPDEKGKMDTLPTKEDYPLVERMPLLKY